MLGRIPFAQFLDRNGDGTGSIEGNANFSAAAVDFFYTPQATFTPKVRKLTLTLETNTPAGNFDNLVSNYGSIVGGLTNGILVRIFANGVFKSLAGGIRLKTNGDLYSAFSTKAVYIPNKGMNQILGLILSATYDFDDNSIANGLAPGDKVVVTLNDDFSSLFKHRFLITGSV